MRYLILGLALLMTPMPLYAEWLEWSSSTTGAVWYVDPERVNVSPGKVKIWVKQDYSRDRTVSYRSAMVQYSIDCQNEKFFMNSMISYDSYGKVVGSKSQNDYGGYGYETIVPETMLDGLARFVCKMDGVGE